MAKRTFNDYILECELYEHSQEYFDILKESSELDIMLTYLNNQSFLEEYASDLADEGFAFTEGFFMEASNENGKESTLAKAASKAASLFNTVTKSITSTFRMIFGFFKRLYQKITNKSTEKAQSSVGNINYESLSAEDKERVKDALEDAWNNNEKYSLSSGDSFDAGSILKSVLNGKFTIYIKNDKKINDNTIISIEDFNDLVSTANKAISSGKIKGKFKSNMGKTINDALSKKRIEIDINPEAFKKAQEDLEAGLDAFEEMINSVSEEIKKGGKLGKIAAGAGVAGVAGTAGLAAKGAYNQFKQVKAEQLAKEQNRLTTGGTHEFRNYATSMKNQILAPGKAIAGAWTAGDSALSGKLKGWMNGAIDWWYRNDPDSSRQEKILQTDGYRALGDNWIINHPMSVLALFVLTILGSVFCIKVIKGKKNAAMFTDITSSVKTLSKNIMSTYQELIAFQNRAVNNIARLI